MVQKLVPPGRPNRQAIAPQPLVAFNAKLLHGGDLEIAGRRIGAADGVAGLECLPGISVYKLPGRETDVLFLEATTGRVTAIRHVASLSQWFHATALFLKTLETATVLPPPVRRSRRFFQYFISRLAGSIRWMDAEYHPYQRMFALADDGAVSLASGGRLAPGDAPFPLSSGETLAINGLDVTLHAENGDVIERLRRPAGEALWKRLVAALLVRPSALGLPCQISERGDLVILPYGLPPYVIAASEPFALHLSNGRSLFRPACGAQIFAVDQTGGVQEFLITPNGRLEKLTGAKDTWIFTLLGCPGEGERPRRYLEVMPGAMTLHDCGTVVILGRAYLAGDAIAVRTTVLRVERSAGACQALFVRTPASVISYIYGLDGQWWLGTPRTPDRSYFSASRLGESENAVTLAFQWLESFVAATPGMARVNQVLAAIGRTADGFASQPLLLHFGIFLAIFLTMGAFAGYWALQIVGLIWGALWRTYRHARRAWELST